LERGKILSSKIFGINTDFHTDKQALLSAGRVRQDHRGAILKRLLKQAVTGRTGIRLDDVS
jgi:hypothetical protein